MLTTLNKITSQTNLREHQAWWLIEFVTHKNRLQLQYGTYQFSQNELEQIDEYIRQIAFEHRPLAYILGFVPFLDLNIKVYPPTLIPRPETEFWVQQLIEELQKNHGLPTSILDIGSGSGCIALALAHAFPAAQVYAVDLAKTAIQLAQENAQINNINNVTFVQSNLFEDLDTNLKFDLIVSNPPYIDPAAQLEPSVAHWEDHQALFAPKFGMAIIEAIVTQAPTWLTQNSSITHQLILEIDASQGAAMHDLLPTSPYSSIIIKKDQFDRDRTAWLTFK